MFPHTRCNTTDTSMPFIICFFLPCLPVGVKLIYLANCLNLRISMKFSDRVHSSNSEETTGFTASCFFGTLLIVFAEIKDFYEFTRCRQHTTSTCTLIGNISVAFTFLISYPFSRRYFTSRAKVAESQLTYTILSGSI